MSLAVSTMPDDPARLAQWLDEQLVGDRLGDVVDELSAVRTSPPSAETIVDALGEALEVVLDRGLVSLSPDRIRRLLRCPRLLLELQELVFLNGGAYWDHLARPAPLVERTSAGWQALSPRLPHLDAPIPLSVVRRSPRRWWSYLGVAVATAASVLVVVTLVGHFRGPDRRASAVVDWGWARPNGIPSSPDARGYYTGLATVAEEWEQVRPATPDTLARRILEFRQGCSALLLAEHKPLNAEQKADLLDRCRKWATKLDATLAKLESGASVEECRSDVDSTVSALVKYLRSQAAPA